MHYVEGDHKEIDRNDIHITERLGIGEFGPLFDAEVKLDVNDVQRAMIKVRGREGGRRGREEGREGGREGEGGRVGGTIFIVIFSSRQNYLH